MGWVAPAMMGASALMGGMGKKSGGKSRSTTQTTRNQMWDEGMGRDLWNKYNDALGQASGIDFGPSGRERRGFNQMWNQAFGGGGGGGQGGGGMADNMGRRGGGGGGGGWQDMFWKVAGTGGGGGGGGGNPNAQYARNNVDYTDYEKSVLDPNYLDVTNDPILQKQQEYRRGLFDENAAGQRNEAMGRFVNAGGTLGLTGAAMGQMGKMQAANERDWLGMENELYAGERAQRMAAQQAANQAWSGRESTYDSSGMSADAQRAAARMAANASMYGSRLGAMSQMQAAQMAANASRYGADRSYQAAMAGVGAQNAANAWNRKLQMMGMAGDMANQRRQGQGLGLMGLYGTALSQNLPWQSGFGTQTTTGYTPGQGSGFGNFMQGAIGGGMTGFGAAKDMGYGFGKKTTQGSK